MNFEGFATPTQNWFKLPNNWTDLTAEMRSLAELKVVEYVLRHTWGYSEYGQLKHISMDEFENGRKRTNGERIDKGVGMNVQAIRGGIKQAVEDGLLLVQVDESDKGRVKKYYGLKMKRGDENHPPDVWNSPPRGMITTHRSEKDTLERNYRKDTVSNGDLKRLKDLSQPEGKTAYVADFILNQLGDRHSAKFYLLVAAKIPEQVIRRALSEIRVDGARHPAKVFTYRMNLYAQQASGSG